MKRFLAVLLIFGGINAALTAQIRLSAGLGGNFTADFSTFTLSKERKDAGEKAENYHSHLLGGGVYAFFDATYVEANIGLLFGNANSDKQREGASDAEKKGTDITALKLGLFGKFPIDLGGSVLFFPMLGIDGQIWLAGKANGKTIDTSQGKEWARDMFNQFWFKAGVGFDVPITEQFYFRAEALYGLRLNTKAEQDHYLKKTEGTPYTDPDDPTKTKTDTYPASASSIIGHGLDIRLGLGFKF